MTQHAEEDTLAHIIAIIDQIWIARNNKFFNDKDTSIQIMIQRAENATHSYQQVIDQDNKRNKNNQSRRQNANMQHRNNWEAPPRNVYKINTDANLSVPDRWGMGAVIRDQSGAMMAITTWVENGDNDPLAAEARGMMLALEFMHNCCFRKVILESDCESVKAINEKHKILKGWGRIIDQIRSLLVLFQISSIQYVGHNSNQAAHITAKQSHIEGNKYSIEEEPYFIKAQACKDLFKF